MKCTCIWAATTSSKGQPMNVLQLLIEEKSCLKLRCKVLIRVQRNILRCQTFKSVLKDKKTTGLEYIEPGMYIFQTAKSPADLRKAMQAEQ